MIKQTNLASVAIRVNNLEQKMKEAEEDGDDGEYEEKELLARRLANMTIGGAVIQSGGAGSPGDEWTNIFYELLNTSITALLFGNLTKVTQNERLEYMTAAYNTSFYQQVFDFNFRNKFGLSAGGVTNNSFAAAVFGNAAGDSYVNHFLVKSLCQTIFGEYDPYFISEKMKGKSLLDLMFDKIQELKEEIDIENLKIQINQELEDIRRDIVSEIGRVERDTASEIRLINLRLDRLEN